MCKQVFSYYCCEHGAGAAFARCEYASTINSPFWMVHECPDYMSVRLTPPLPRFCGGPGWYCGDTQIGKILDLHYETLTKAQKIISEIPEELDEMVWRGRSAAHHSGMTNAAGMLWNEYDIQRCNMLLERFTNATQAQADARAILRDGHEFLSRRGQGQNLPTYELPDRFADGLTPIREPLPVLEQPEVLTPWQVVELRNHKYSTPQYPAYPPFIGRSAVASTIAPRMGLIIPPAASQLSQTTLQRTQHVAQPGSAPTKLAKTSSPSLQKYGMPPSTLPDERPASYFGQASTPRGAGYRDSSPSKRPASKKQKISAVKLDSVRRSQRVRKRTDYAESETSSRGTSSPEKADKVSPQKLNDPDDVFGPSRQQRPVGGAGSLMEMFQEYKRRMAQPIVAYKAQPYTFQKS